MNARGGVASGNFKLARGAVGLVQRRRRWPVASQRGVVSSTVSRKVPKIYERRAVGSMAPPRRGIHTREERVYEATGEGRQQIKRGPAPLAGEQVSLLPSGTEMGDTGGVPN